MATISGVIYDDSGNPAAGRIVRVYRRDTGVLLGASETGDGVTLTGVNPNYSNISVLLLGNGTDGGTTFLDSGPAARTITKTGTVETRTAQSKFGGSSIFVDGSTTSYLTVTDSTGAFNVGSGDFTVEAWLYHASRPGNKGVLFATADGRFKLTDDDSRWVLQINGSSNVFVHSYTPILNEWFHMRLCRSGATTRLFRNGLLMASGGSVNPTSHSNTDLRIGRDTATGYQHNGYIEDFCFIKGVALSTDGSAFSVPTFQTPTTGIVLDLGAYQIDCGAYTGEVQRIVLDDDAGTLYNDIIDRVFPG